MFFFHQPLLLRFEHTQVARLRHQQERAHMTMNEIKYPVFSANWQPRVPKYNWVNWQWVGFTNHMACNAHLRITDCSIVFQINKYVNLACFLNICKHIMVFLCFSRVKILHTAPLNNDLIIFICRRHGFSDEALLLRRLPWYCGLHKQHARGHCMLAVRMCIARRRGRRRRSINEN